MRNLFFIKLLSLFFIASPGFSTFIDNSNNYLQPKKKVEEIENIRINKEDYTKAKNTTLPWFMTKNFKSRKKQKTTISSTENLNPNKEEICKYAKPESAWFEVKNFKDLEIQIQEFFQQNLLRQKIAEFENIYLKDNKNEDFRRNFDTLIKTLFIKLDSSKDLDSSLKILTRVLFLGIYNTLYEFQCIIDNLSDIYSSSRYSYGSFGQTWCYSTINSKLTLLQALDYILCTQKISYRKTHLNNIKKKSLKEGDKVLPQFLRSKDNTFIEIETENFLLNNDINFTMEEMETFQEFLPQLSLQNQTFSL